MRARKTGLRKSNNFLESTKLFQSHNVLSCVCSQCQVNNYHRLQNFEHGAAEQPRHQKSVSWLVLIMHVPAGQKGKKYRKKKKTNKQTGRRISSGLEKKISNNSKTLHLQSLYLIWIFRNEIAELLKIVATSRTKCCLQYCRKCWNVWLWPGDL